MAYVYQDVKLDRLADALIYQLSTTLVKLGEISSIASVAKAYTSGLTNLSNGYPYITITAASGHNCVIELQPVAATPEGQYDALGLTQKVYNPHQVNVLFDKTVAGGTDPAIYLDVMYEVSKLGCQVQVFNNATVTIAQLDTSYASAPVISLQDVQWGFLNQQ